MPGRTGRAGVRQAARRPRRGHARHKRRKGIEFGTGFAFAAMRGSQANDAFCNDNGRISTATNHSGGIQGGISNGQDIYFRIAFKPVATLLQEQQTVTADGQPTTLKARGRHDPCVLPRAVPIVEAMTAMTLLDYYLIEKQVICSFLTNGGVKFMPNALQITNIAVSLH